MRVYALGNKPTSWWPSSKARRPCCDTRGRTAVGKGAGECETAKLAALLCVPRITASLLCSSVARRRSRRRTTPFVNQQREGLRQPASSSAAREVVSWGHPNYPPNNPELPPNNPQRTLKYPSRTPRHPSELHHNYPPTTPQLHPNNPEPPIKTTSGMYQVPQTGAKQAQTGSEVSLSLVGVYTRTLLLPSTCPVGALWDPPFFAHLPKCKHP